MIADLAGLALSLALILFAAELFTNGVEWLGHRLNLAEGAVGSVLAAVGTAMPETMVPLVAILLVGTDASKQVGIGSILGAPFMLSTLAFAITGLAAILYRRRRVQGARISINQRVLHRDLTYFLFMYSVAVLVGIVRFPGYHVAVPLFLLAGYLVYLYLNLREAGELNGGLSPLRLQAWLTHALVRPVEGEEEHAFHKRRETHKHRTPRLRIIGGQVLLALAGIVLGAHVFVHGVQAVSVALGVDPLLISLVLVPIATELPEKFNSVIWVRQGKDTLALGNITGAMVFQSSIPVSVGVAFTRWELVAAGGKVQAALYSAGIALLSGALLLLLSRRRQGRRLAQVSPAVLLTGLLLYGLFIFLVFG